MARKRVLVVDDLTPVVTALLCESFDVVDMVSDGRAALEAKALTGPNCLGRLDARHERNRGRAGTQAARQ